MRRNLGRVVLLSMLVVSMSAACGEEDSPRRLPIEESGSGETTVPGSTDLDAALADAGVVPESMPRMLGALDGFEICGSDHRSIPPGEASAAARCFLDRTLAELDAVYVTTGTTVEGDPVTSVYVTGADGKVAAFHDATRDRFGSGEWSRFDARRVAARTSNGSVDLELIDGVEVALDAALPEPVDEEAPEWFTERPVLAWCGMDVEVEDAQFEARTCIRQAIESGTPSEYAIGQHGDEGERSLFWYRVLGPGRIEVVQRQLPGAPPFDTPPPSWARFECGSAPVTFLDAPGSPVDAAPRLDTLERCEQLDG